MNRAGWRAALAGAVVCLATLLSGSGAQSFGPAPLATWVVSGGSLGGLVSAVAVSGSTAYVGGDFTYMGPSTGSFVSFDAAGASTTPWPKVGGSVYAAIPDGAGGWYVGGSFDSIGTQHAENVAHILADGTLDTDWLGSTKGTNGTVLALHLSGATLYVGGAFTEADGTARDNLAAFTASTGSLTSFRADVGGSDSIVFALAFSGSTLFLGGDFTTVAGSARSNLAAVDATSGALAAWNPQTDDIVFSLALDPGVPVIYAGGAFTTVNGATPRSSLAAFDVTTGVATAWDPAPDSNVYGLALSASGGTVYVGGQFENIGGAPRNSLAALSSTTGLATAWDPDVAGVVFWVGVSGTTVFAGGDFQRVNGALPRHHAAAFDATGTATSFAPTVGGTVHVVAVSGATVAVGGDFRSVGGVRRDNLGAIDLATGQATGWDPNVDDLVTTLAVSGSTVYAGGSFTTVNETTMRNRLAAFDGGGNATAWNPNVADGIVHALGVSGSTVYAGGTFSSVNGGTARIGAAAFDGTGTATSWNPSTNGSVFALALSGSTVYLGGSFTSVGAITRNNLAAVDSGSGAPSPWDPNVNDDVNALALSGDRVYAGGAFTTVNGGTFRSAAAAFLASSGVATAWDPQLSSRASYVDPITPGAVYALAASESVVYIGGDFQTIGSGWASSLAASPAVPFTSTAPITTWLPSPNGPVYALALGPQGLVAGGPFSALGYPQPGEAYSPTETGATYTAGFAALPAVPDAPTAVAAVAAGPTSATVSFTPPAYDGGSPITSYRVTSSTGRSATGTASPITVSGLASGTSLTFIVTASTAIDTSPPSAVSNPVTLVSGGTGSTGGGGGGGGAGAAPNLNVAVAPASAVPAVGSGFALRITIANKSIRNSDNSTLTVTLAGLTYVASQAERGPGCTLAGSTVTCPLDFFPGLATSSVVLFVQVASLPATAQATVTSYPGDSDPSDDAASWSSAGPFIPAAAPSSGPTGYPPPEPQKKTTLAVRSTTLKGTARADTIRGTARNEVLRGLGGNDVLRGAGGNDSLLGGSGSDRLFGGTGNDTIHARDGNRDSVDCGTGRDIVNADRGDSVARNCEIVRRK